MGKIHLKFMKSQEEQGNNPSVQREFQSVQEYLDRQSWNMDTEGIYIILLKGLYDDLTKKMTTVMVFVNHSGKAIRELSGVLHIRVQDPEIQIARVTFGFDTPFFGRIQQDEGILLHVQIPVKGQKGDRIFEQKDLIAELSKVKITYEEEENEKVY